jgi:hypothetical protein
MPTVQDRTSIANIALSYLGAGRIQSFDQDNEEAAYVRDLYEQAVRECLEDHPWNFAEKAAALAADATPVRPDFDYSYNMPPDHLATRWLMTNDGRRSEETFRMTDGDKLCTDLERAWLVYTYRAGEHLFSPLFVAALAHLLAHRLAGPITESDSKVEGHYRLYVQTLARARNRNGQQDSPEQIETNTLTRWHSG